ncbi:MAG: hypothetical protein U5K32_04295 [Bacteroidales bacterium]|nr:hypothetical protein [Bacteroidales bacterium]
MKKILFITLAAVLAVFTGCEKEYAPPALEAPASETVETSTPVDLTFSYTADGGFKSSSVTATNGSAVVATDGTDGETSGNIIVTFTAGNAAGAGSVTLNIFDSKDQTDAATAVITVYEEGAPDVTAPSSTDVEVIKSVDLTFSIAAEGGYASSSVSAGKGSAVVKTEPAAGASSGDVVVTFTAGREAGAGSVELTATDENGKNGIATAVLDIKDVSTVSVSDNIDTDTTWETGKVYILEGRIAVVDGVTLTIEPGVIVKGREGEGSNATALLIARGAKLMAEGTDSSPIIFTSVADNILPGEIESPNMDTDLNGLWGGLLILGKAPISADATAVQIEGIPPSDQNGLYGGTEENDNSGVIRYISIRHGGANIGEGNEINGLTLGGIGSGTTIENVEIIANQDDGIEWFGGKVNVTNAIVWNTGDDAIDTDQSWGGTLDNFIIINPGDECFELDGPEGTMVDKHTIKNGSAWAGDAQGLVDLDNNSNVDMDGVYFFGLATDQDFDQIPTVYACTFENFEATLPASSILTDFFKDGSDAFTTAEGCRCQYGRRRCISLPGLVMGSSIRCNK